MATVTRSRRTVRTPHGTARLTLHINGASYSLRPIDSPDGRAFLIRKPDGTRYHVAETTHGLACDCGDFTWHRDGLDRDGCKHIRALVAVGLLTG